MTTQRSTLAVLMGTHGTGRNGGGVVISPAGVKRISSISPQLDEALQQLAAYSPASTSPNDLIFGLRSGTCSRR